MSHVQVYPSSDVEVHARLHRRSHHRAHRDLLRLNDSADLLHHFPQHTSFSARAVSRVSIYTAEPAVQRSIPLHED